jgi:4-carboxymuconolactone decarboxylase
LPDRPKTRPLFAKGMQTRRAVLGDAHVDGAKASQTDFDAPFQALITEGAWGAVWSRPHWSKRERSMVTIALLAALGHDEELAMHVRATRNTGATEEDLREAMMHVAIYAGVPAANRAIKIIKQTYAAMEAGRRKKSPGKSRRGAAV